MKFFNSYKKEEESLEQPKSKLKINESNPQIMDYMVELDDSAAETIKGGCFWNGGGAPGPGIISIP